MNSLKNMNININLNRFLKDFSSKKQYFKKVKHKSINLAYLKQNNYYKLLNNYLTPCDIKKNNLTQDSIIMYIIDITFSRSNTFLHVMDAEGRLKFFASAGCLKYKGKTKKFRLNVLKSIYKVLITKLKYLKGKPVAIHLKNVGFNKFWIIKKLKTKFFIKIVKVFNLFPFNGCRNKKIKRKKVKSKKK